MTDCTGMFCMGIIGLFQEMLYRVIPNIYIWILIFFVLIGVAMLLSRTPASVNIHLLLIIVLTFVSVGDTTPIFGLMKALMYIIGIGAIVLSLPKIFRWY